MKPPTPEELMSLARRAFTADHRTTASVQEEIELGAVPSGAGQELVATRRIMHSGRSLVIFRIFLLDADRRRIPTRWGVQLLSDALPGFAALCAAALRAELCESDDQHSHGKPNE